MCLNLMYSFPMSIKARENVGKIAMVSVKIYMIRDLNIRSIGIKQYFKYLGLEVGLSYILGHSVKCPFAAGCSVGKSSFMPLQKLELLMISVLTAILNFFNIVDGEQMIFNITGWKNSLHYYKNIEIFSLQPAWFFNALWREGWLGMFILRSMCLFSRLVMLSMLWVMNVSRFLNCQIWNISVGSLGFTQRYYI